MVFDYSEIQSIAIELIEEFGRSVTFQRFDQSVGDPLKPWDGPASTTNTPDATLTTSATFVEPDSAAKLGISVEYSTLIKESEQIMLVAPPTTFTTDDLETFTEVIDGNVRWKITKVEKLKPGSTTLLYFAGVKR